LVAIREEVTRTLMRAQFHFQPAPPELPAFITQHLDPFLADDDTADIDASARGLMAGLPPLLNIPQPALPQRDAAGNVAEAPISRNGPRAGEGRAGTQAVRRRCLSPRL